MINVNAKIEKIKTLNEFTCTVLNYALIVESENYEAVFKLQNDEDRWFFNIVNGEYYISAKRSERSELNSYIKLFTSFGFIEKNNKFIKVDEEIHKIMKCYNKRETLFDYLFPETMKVLYIGGEMQFNKFILQKFGGSIFANVNEINLPFPETIVKRYFKEINPVEFLVPLLETAEIAKFCDNKAHQYI